MAKTLAGYALYLLVLIVLLAPALLAATLHGAVYDLNLEKVSGVVLELNSTPTQRVISNDGTYAFHVPLGAYRIDARQLSGNHTLARANENISIIDDGEYTLDIFLYPSLEEEESLLNSTGMKIMDLPTQSMSLLFPLMVVVIILLIIIILILVRVSPKLAVLSGQARPQPHPHAAAQTSADHQSLTESPQTAESVHKSPSNSGLEQISPDPELETVLTLLRQEGGRSTQKELRKNIPLSEAKVSLILTELEAKGLVEKIKKGRGNIIILKKD